MEYYIYITNDCNMNCVYCSVLFDTKKFGVPLLPQYSWEDLEKFATKTQNALNDNIADIYFFGGEPTMNYQKIEELIDAFNKPHNFKVNYIMHTNGLLIKDAPTSILSKLNLTILSFNYDLFFVKNKIAPYLKEMTYAIQRIKAIKNIPIIGRLTISPNTSLYTECCLINSFVDYVYWQLDNCEQINNYDDYSQQYKREIDMLFDFWITNLKKGNFLKFVPFMSAIKNLLFDTNKPPKFYCGYGSSMIYVQTNGQCYACCDNVATKSHYIGDIYNGIKFSNQYLDETICNDCSYIKLCGGRCGRMHKDFSTERINQFCELNKYMFDLLIDNITVIRNIIFGNEKFIQDLCDPMIMYTEYTA